MSASRYLRGFPGLLRRIADRLDPTGAPHATGFSFTVEPVEGIRFRDDRRGCPIWYLGEDDYQRAHDEAGPAGMWRTGPGKVRVLWVPQIPTPPGIPPVLADDAGGTP